MKYGELVEFTVAELFGSGHYLIPLYQRNYSWQEKEITQLILDIRDYAQEQDVQNYYIGSLVVFRREELKENFEIIDGQQRHTTLSILLSVLKNEFNCFHKEISSINLDFVCRKRSALSLQALFAEQLLSDYEPSILNAYEICKKCISSTFEESEINRFFDFLTSQVKIIRVCVPQDTDLNHYFEIMNNRGEQLEKHEILKARLMDTLDKNDKAELNAFAVIWDACSDMHRYVQYGFRKEFRHTIFGRDLNDVPTEFTFIKTTIGANEDVESAKTVLDSMRSDVPKEPLEQNKDQAPSEQFESVITFSNFLLHVLRIYYTDKIRSQNDFDISLDDKSLLDSFKGLKDAAEVRKFIMVLLQLRLLFDTYVIKKEWDNKWSLEKIRWYENYDNINYVNTFDDESINSHLIMMLSMLHVSFPSQTYKHWLTGVLDYLYTRLAPVDPKAYLDFLESFDSRLFFGRFSSVHIDYQYIIFKETQPPWVMNETYLEKSTDTQNYIFNRLDYLIWKANKLSSRNLPETLKLSDKIIRDFSFSFRSSVEHHYPQHPEVGEKLEESEMLPLGVDTFGNLCLISRSNNSRFSNFLPAAKIEHCEKLKIKESLKQQLMMKYGAEWGPEYTQNIATHEKAMIALLKKNDSEITVDTTYV